MIIHYGEGGGGTNGKMVPRSDKGLSFHFMTKNEKIFFFFINIFLDFIKFKLRPKSKI